MYGQTSADTAGAPATPSTASPVGPTTDRKPITLPRLQQMRETGEKIAMLTCYDASFATLLDDAGVDVLLIGDSLGMVLQGQSSTLPVSMDDMAYHTRCVARGTRKSLVLTDMPHGSYHESPAQAYANAARLMAAGAAMVKIEGGEWVAPTVAFLVERGIPVCAHIGFTPQSVHALGGYRVQGRTPEAAQRLRMDALALQKAGASLVLMEMVPAGVAEELTAALTVPTIGIGAGAGCSGQVLVMHDMLGVYPGKKARFVRNFLDGQQGRTSIQAAVQAYVQAVKEGSYPAPEHAY